MIPADLVIPPPIPKLVDYPAAIGVSFLILFTSIVLIVSNKFDMSGGVLTISLLVILSFLGAAVFCLFFTVPSNEITASVIGGLTAAFGAVVAYWLGKSKEPPR
jgi:uncharacterized BrkB/YihY/UPF0761 family membrane protein